MATSTYYIRTIHTPFTDRNACSASPTMSFQSSASPSSKGYYAPPPGLDYGPVTQKKRLPYATPRAPSPPYGAPSASSAPANGTDITPRTPITNARGNAGASLSSTYEAGQPIRRMRSRANSFYQTPLVGPPGLFPPPLSTIATSNSKTTWGTSPYSRTSSPTLSPSSILYTSVHSSSATAKRYTPSSAGTYQPAPSSLTSGFTVSFPGMDREKYEAEREERERERARDLQTSRAKLVAGILLNRIRVGRSRSMSRWRACRTNGMDLETEKNKGYVKSHLSTVLFVSSDDEEGSSDEEEGEGEIGVGLC